MNAIIRRIAVSGAAAVALTGGAATITIAASDTAVAAETHTVAERAVTAPVKLPDGRTLRITGMGGYGHTATREHVATVAAFKTDTTDPSDITNGLTPDNGTGAQLQNPITGVQPTGINGQVQTQASGAAIGTGVVAILLLGTIMFFRVKGGHLKVGDAVVVMFFGVAVAGTVIGGMADQITDNGVASLGSIFAGL